MQVGDEITIEAGELVAGGESLARVDGLPVFVANIYPGDVARVVLTEVKKGFARASLVAIEQPSPLRRTAPCPIADECGGCDWTHLRLDAQLRAKERILRESLRRIGKITSLPAITVHPSPLNYRLRSRLHEEEGAVGFYAMRSHRVVPLAPECEVVGVETAKHPVAGQSWEVEGTVVTSGELVINGYHVSTEAFFQVNRHLLSTLLARVSALAAGVSTRRSAIDLYSGVGFFSRPLAQLFERVTAVEGSAVSHEYAKRNVPSNVRLMQAAVEEWVERMPRADLIFLDPPRGGARRNVIDAVARRAGEMIAFLACDPVTFARDASRLIAYGWRLASLDLVDLFPNTHHVETLASFLRAER
ncbi:MAG TPA: TRAM domain-containing protein [Thermoanaerobaculia bacterium]|jgi:tRNA/tmRNA/rRNA uracil-C5-methylase (TrmA/RlmC/RlmD family)|nr:TRAM domain-containing protein [Thermoanaerobaculia bacterium]